MTVGEEYVYTTAWNKNDAVMLAMSITGKLNGTTDDPFLPAKSAGNRHDSAAPTGPLRWGSMESLCPDPADGGVDMVADVCVSVVNERKGEGATSGR